MQPSEHAICLLFVGNERQPNFVVERCRIPAALRTGEVLVRVRIAGICGLDLRYFVRHGKEKEPSVPIIPGHEAVGDVLASTNPDIKIGERVVFSISYWCMNCEWCNRQIHLACPNIKKYGHQTVADGIGLNGAFSSHVVLRKGTAIAVIPQSVPDGPALLAACPLAIAYSGVLRMLRCHHPQFASHKSGSASKSQPEALIKGFGLLGILTSCILVEKGFKVFCTDTNVNRLHLAPKFHAEPIYDESVLAARLDLVVLALGDGRTGEVDNCDDHLSHQSFKSESVLGLIRHGGTLLLVGHSSSSFVICSRALYEKSICVIGASEYEPANLVDAVNFLLTTERKYPYKELLSPIYDLLDFQNALASAVENKFFRVVVRPTAG